MANSGSFRKGEKRRNQGKHGPPRATLAARDSIKGEFTLLIGKATEPAPDDTPLDDAVDALERSGTPRMDAIKQVARRRGLSKREVYAQLLSSRKE